uniref:Small ribosomal subunit protein uS5c n=1 Tax=Gloeochaete wittrockiana TaxID=38269 RepID=A0A3G1IVZ1_9EUKA|nr:ribosomal protein S5 [Gloeochaete wittrockiana]ASQ40227.1 ribosomal protein S5 [Gloeochaete wittrockiana]
MTKQKLIRARQTKKREWEHKVVEIRRVSKVVKGGKKLSFSAIIVIGDEKGQVGIGIGKASDARAAITKGITNGQKELIKVPLTKTYTVSHTTQGKEGASQVIIRPATSGTGVIAGGAVRTVLELAGIKNILAKQLGSNNKLNNARATIDALSKLKVKMNPIINNI